MPPAKKVIQSAYSNAGQKCSTTNLLILQKELCQSKEFKNKLLHAVNGIKIGSPWDFDVKLGLLSTPINDRIEKIINSFQVTPSILWGVNAGDYFNETEFFGPILGVIKAKNVNEALSLANGVAYGLTVGIESLNPPSVKYWAQNIKAGNLYINRRTTGAIVQRQPFGD